MITFQMEYTQAHNCTECKKRLGLPLTSSKCIYDIKYNNIITFKFKNIFDIAIHTCSIQRLVSCCYPNLMYYITPIATLHKKLLL